MKIEAQIVYAKRYNFTDNQSGRIVKGCRIDYYPINTEDCTVDEQDQKGLLLTSLTGDYDLFRKLRNLPNKYLISCEIKPDASGRPKIIPIDVSDIILEDDSDGGQSENEESQSENLNSPNYFNEDGIYSPATLE